jgi:hypothetical protein
MTPNKDARRRLNWEAAQEPDPKTGHWPGWLPVGDGPDDKYHREAFGSGEYGPKDFQHGMTWNDGTYELVGPKVSRATPKSSAYGHVLLVCHGDEVLS